MFTMVRILPMDRKYEFKGRSIEDLQNNFFLKELPLRKDQDGWGKYYYKSHGMKADEKSTLVLFQYDNRIIAHAKLNRIVKFNSPIDVYNGAFYFEPASITTFNPLTNKEINKIFHCDIKFNQAKHKLDIKYIEPFLQELKKKKSFNKNI